MQMDCVSPFGHSYRLVDALDEDVGFHQCAWCGKRKVTSLKATVEIIERLMNNGK